MIDITTSISPIEREYPNGISIEKWVGDIVLKGGVDGSIIHYPIECESPKRIVEHRYVRLKA